MMMMMMMMVMQCQTMTIIDKYEPRESWSSTAHWSRGESDVISVSWRVSSQPLKLTSRQSSSSLLDSNSR